MSIPIDKIKEGWYWFVPNQNKSFNYKASLEMVEFFKCGGTLDMCVRVNGGFSYLGSFLENNYIISRNNPPTMPEFCSVCNKGVYSRTKDGVLITSLCSSCKGSGWKGKK